MSDLSQQRLRHALSRDQMARVNAITPAHVPHDTWDPSRIPPHELEREGRPLSDDEKRTVHQHRVERHRRFAEDHKEKIKSSIIDSLSKFKIAEVLEVNLRLGIGDLHPETPASRLDAVEDALDGMHRVQELAFDSDIATAEIIPMRIYCFRDRGVLSFEIGRLLIREEAIDQPMDVLRFESLQIESRRDDRGRLSLTSLFNRIEKYTAIGPHPGVPREKRYHWKSAKFYGHVGTYSSQWSREREEEDDEDLSSELLGVSPRRSDDEAEEERTRKTIQQMSALSGRANAIQLLKSDKGEGGNNERRKPYIFRETE